MLFTIPRKPKFCLRHHHPAALRGLREVAVPEHGCNSATGKVQDFCQKLGESAVCGGIISMRKDGRFVI